MDLAEPAKVEMLAVVLGPERDGSRRGGDEEDEETDGTERHGTSAVAEARCRGRKLPA
jgi:hypothetical protein